MDCVYVHTESAFIVMSTEMGLYLWTPGDKHVFHSISDNELWIYGLVDFKVKQGGS
jgi:hypothetical protein